MSYGVREDSSRMRMYILGLLLIGLAAGWLASVLVRGRGLGVGGDILVGIVGAVVGGLVFDALGIAAAGTIGSFVSAVVGAVLLLLVVRAFQPSTPVTRDIP